MWRRRVPEMLVATSDEIADITVRRRLLVSGGYKWLRVAVRPWQDTLRNPVIGQLFEITRYPVPGGILLTSVEASRAIHLLCG